MTTTTPQPEGRAPASLDPVSDMTIPSLVARVYESAPATERCQLVATLMKPLGILSLMAIANGIFAKIRFRHAGQDLNVGIDDLQNVSAADMVALVHHVQQASIETIDGLMQMLGTANGTASSAAAALLIGLLVQRARARRSTPARPEDSSLDPG